MFSLLILVVDIDKGCIDAQFISAHGPSKSVLSMLVVQTESGACHIYSKMQLMCFFIDFVLKKIYDYREETSIVYHMANLKQ